VAGNLDTAQPEFGVAFADAAYRVLVCENIVVSVENVEPNAAYIMRLTRVMLDTANKSPNGIGFMTLIRSDAKPPDEEARIRIKRSIPDLTPHLRAFAHVVEGEGFLAAAKRSAMTFLMSTQRFSFPLKVFRSVSEAAPWLFKTMAEAAPRATSALHYAKMLEQLRREHFTKPAKASFQSD
jgi:hypothetical protein